MNIVYKEGKKLWAFSWVSTENLQGQKLAISHGAFLVVAENEEVAAENAKKATAEQKNIKLSIPYLLEENIINTVCEVK